MTVLRKEDARGFDSKRTRGFVVGMAMAVIGLGAAFGISQLFDDSGAEGSPVATLHTQAPAYAQPSQSPVATLGGEAPAYAQDAEAVPGTTLTQQNELAAIHGRTGTEPTASSAAVGQPTADQVLAGIQGRTGYQASVTETVKPTIDQELALIEARTGVEPRPFPEQPSGPR